METLHIAQKVQKKFEVPKLELVDKVVDVTGIMQRIVPKIQSTHKPVMVPRVQFIDNMVEEPTVMQSQDAEDPTYSASCHEDSGELNEAADEDTLDNEKKKRRVTKRTETVFESCLLVCTENTTGSRSWSFHLVHHAAKMSTVGRKHGTMAAKGRPSL